MAEDSDENKTSVSVHLDRPDYINSVLGNNTTQSDYNNSVAVSVDYKMDWHHYYNAVQHGDVVCQLI